LDPKTGLSGLALVCGLGLLAAFYLAISSQTAVLGRDLQELEATKSALIWDNDELRQQIALNASIIDLQERALGLGFVPAENVLFLNVPVSTSE
jgi:hypothetical protein